VSNLPIFVAPPNLKLPSAPSSSPSDVESAELLRQLVELQREQVGLARAAAVAADSQTRWRNFLGRWQHEFPEIGPACKEVLPVIERTYLRIIQELADRLRGDDADDLDNEYVLAEFLDRYGMRLTQLGTIVGQLSPIADATPPATEPATEESEPK
jgi:hypothetical protein